MDSVSLMWLESEHTMWTCCVLPQFTCNECVVSWQWEDNMTEKKKEKSLVCLSLGIMWGALGPAIRLSFENDFSQHLNKAASCLCMSVAGILSSSLSCEWHSVAILVCPTGNGWQLKVIMGGTEVSVCVYLSASGLFVLISSLIILQKKRRGGMHVRRNKRSF